MLHRTFQVTRGVGPWRERDYWARGIQRWDDFPPQGEDALVASAIEEARAALLKRDLPKLASLLPEREHWRLYPEFSEEAAFFDVEADGPHGYPTVVSVFDSTGLRVFIQGRNLDELPEALNRRALWVTFNGRCFDVPVLLKHFTSLSMPVVHLDLRFLCRRVGLRGGLKQVEDTLKMNRPRHLVGLNGWDATALWRAFSERREVAYLRTLVEYNLYDTFHLRTVLETAFNRALEKLGFDDPPLRVFERGDILYDVSRLLLSLEAHG